MSDKNILMEKVFQTINGKRTLVGLFLAKIVKGNIRLGYSRCRPCDKFTMTDAKINAGRNLSHGIEPFSNPKGFTSFSKRAADFVGQYNAFKIRSMKYFKGVQLSIDFKQPDMTAENMANKKRDEELVVESIIKSFRANLSPFIMVDDKLLRDFVGPFVKLGRVLERQGIPMFGGVVNLNSTVQPANTPEVRQAAFDQYVAMAVASGVKTPAWMMEATGGNALKHPVISMATLQGLQPRDAKGRFMAMFSTKVLA